MDHDRRLHCCFQLRDQIEINRGRADIDPVCSSDRRRVGIDPGFADKIDGIFKAGKGRVLGRDLHCIFDTDDSAELTLHIHTLAVGIFYDFAAAGDILLEGKPGSVVHD